MADIFVGVVAILAGGVLLFAGQFVLRLVLTVWGGLRRFRLGGRALRRTDG
ncbi:MAG: hypothetical protein ABI112_07330 [Terracoccus sp.]